jgi:hypothetical protein
MPPHNPVDNLIFSLFVSSRLPVIRRFMHCSNFPDAMTTPPGAHEVKVSSSGNLKGRAVAQRLREIRC